MSRVQSFIEQLERIVVRGGWRSDVVGTVVGLSAFILGVTALMAIYGAVWGAVRVLLAIPGVEWLVVGSITVAVVAFGVLAVCGMAFAVLMVIGDVIRWVARLGSRR